LATNPDFNGQGPVFYRGSAIDIADRLNKTGHGKRALLTHPETRISAQIVYANPQTQAGVKPSTTAGTILRAAEQFRFQFDLAERPNYISLNGQKCAQLPKAYAAIDAHGPIMLSDGEGKRDRSK
jgi:hypothetical protein